MADDRSYIQTNTRERERLRALIERLGDDDLTAPVNEYWTVAGVLGHIAYWDIRRSSRSPSLRAGPMAHRPSRVAT